MGTLHEGMSNLDVIIHPSQPQTILGGFASAYGHPQLRPTDGRLLYDHPTNHILVFHADTFVPNPPYPAYPVNPVGNDTPILTPACSGNDWAKLVGFFPDDGAAFYSCLGPTSGSALYLEGTAPTTPTALANNNVVAPGANRSALIRKPYDQLAVRLSSGTEITVTGLPVHTKQHARFVNGSFLVALLTGFNPAAAELWRIALDGTATLIGPYSGFGTIPEPTWQGARLDGSGVLFAFTYYPGGVDRLEQFSAVGSPRAVVYDETGKTVKIHIPQLVTGF